MSFIDLHTNVSLGHTKIVGLGGEKLWLCPTLGGDKLDISGNGNHGTYYGGMGTVADTTSGGSRAYSFDGVDDYIDVDNGITCGGHSVACWIYADTTSLRMRFIDSYDRSVSTTAPQNVIQHEANTGIRAFSQISGNAIGSYTSINASQWYHIVSVLDGSDLKFYLDGSLVDTVAYTPTPDVDWVRIGARNNGSERVDGRMDDIRIFDRALSTSEITHIATKRGVLGTPRNPVIKKRRIFYAPAAPVTTTAKAVVLKKPKPSYATGYARNASESANPNLWKGLVGAWMPSFGVTGGEVKELTSKSPNLTLQNIPYSNWEVKDKSLAVMLEGNDDYLNGSYCDAVNFGYESFAVTSHFYVTGYNALEAMFDGRTPSSPYRGFHTYMRYSDRVQVQLRSSGALDQYLFLFTSIGGQLATDKIHSMSTVVDRQKATCIQYVNGINIGSASISAGMTDINPNADFRFGRNIANQYPLTGGVTSLFIHHRALNQREVKTLHANPAAPFERKQQTVGISTAQAFNPYWANQATQLAGTLQ